MLETPADAARNFLFHSGELPPDDVETPAFVVCEAGVIHNLEVTLAACGGPERFMPHVKTHRALWVVDLLRSRGVDAFKTATVAEAEMLASRGAGCVTLAYPKVNRAAILRLVRIAGAHPGTDFVALVDSPAGLENWREALKDGPANIGLRVDLDPDFGRTGLPLNQTAVGFARAVAEMGRFAGWHLYDGNVHGPRADRERVVAAEAEAVGALNAQLAADGLSADLVAGGSYTFDLWPREVARFVSPGSWTYSSDQHDIELAELGWVPAAFVLSTVTSSHEGTVTFDAGVKAIAPDKPMRERFRVDGEIILMAEEHSVVRGTSYSVGDRVLLMPRHACTTAYLYDKALVRRLDGGWEQRSQMGNTR